MRKVLTGALLAAGAGVLFFGAAYWGYLKGIRSSSVYDANAYMATMIEQRSCIDARDWDCVSVSSDVMASLLATRLEVLREEELVDESVAEAVDYYLEWQKDQENVE